MRVVNMEKIRYISAFNPSKQRLTLFFDNSFFLFRGGVFITKLKKPHSDHDLNDLNVLKMHNVLCLETVRL